MSNHHRQIILNGMGALCALLIVFGGWFLTGCLLDRQEASLLSATGSVSVPPPTDIGPEPSDTPDYPSLNESEIYTVLNRWSFEGEELPHEPKEGQLSMEQAIAAGKNGLAFFSEQAVIPKEFLSYDKINATLCENIPNESKLFARNPLIRPDDIRSEEELELFYSYWTITLTSNQGTATLVINAVTGQIWKAKIDILISSSALPDIADIKIAEVFMTYLDMEENPLFEANVQSGYMKQDDELSKLTLAIFLSKKQ